MTTKDDDRDETATALSRRLATLGAMPVDTSSLERRLRQQLPPLPASRRRRWWAPLTAVAASLLLVLAVALPLMQNREVQASPTMMAQMYQDMVDGRVPTMRTNSVAEANHVIAAFNLDFPKLPQPPASHMMACCMRNVGNKKVACVLLQNGSTPVTMVVANAADVQSPKSSIVVRDGKTYHVQATGDLNMVMTERNNRWICLIAKMPRDQLMDVARGIQF